MNLAALDWEVLDRLRETFLRGDKTAGPYWHTITDLECYDLTYAERIGWKWDAVLAELKLRGWSPPPQATILDWGCGSGVAGRRVLAAFGAENFSRLVLHDRSPLALDFAEHRARQSFPTLASGRADTRFLRGEAPIDVLVVSHVVNELDEIARAELTGLCARARTILWVEPGTHEVSRALGAWRERLRERFALVAPCPHQTTCGMLRPGNERHWCHFFAHPPAGLLADSDWVRFGQRAGIDLRSIPYSFLTLDRAIGSKSSSDHKIAGGGAGDLTIAATDQNSPLALLSRIIGEPRLYKGYAKIFNCDASGVHELMLQKRDAPALLKELSRHGAGPELHRWTHENGRITRIESSPGATEPSHETTSKPQMNTEEHG